MPEKGRCWFSAFPKDELPFRSPRTRIVPKQDSSWDSGYTFIRLWLLDLAGHIVLIARGERNMDPIMHIIGELENEVHYNVSSLMQDWTIDGDDASCMPVQPQLDHLSMSDQMLRKDVASTRDTRELRRGVKPSLLCTSLFYALYENLFNT